MKRKEDDHPIEQEETKKEQAIEAASENPSEKLEEKLSQLNDSHLRLMAEFDNYRKRTIREKSELIKSAGENILFNILPLIDDFERGIEASKTASDVAAVREGMLLIYDKFISFLCQNGVKKIETDNQVFNTEFHEAITTIPAPTEEQKGKIIDCIQKGYTLNDKVIRFAKVVVGE